MSEPTKQLPPSAWQPGESANPGGRPKWLKEFRDLARENVPEAVNKLLEFVRGKVQNGDEEQTVPLRLQFQAVQELLDRTLGKAVQTSHIDVGLDTPVIAMTEREKLMDDMELARRIAFSLAEGLHAQKQLQGLPTGAANGQ